MKLWLLEDYNYSKFLFFKELADRFYRETSIKVDIEIKSRKNLWNSIFYFFEDPEKSLGDIIEIPHQWTSIMAKLGLLLELSIVYEDFNENKILKFLKKTMSCDESEKLFSLPLYFEVFTLQCRADMCGKFISRKELENITWSDFIMLCEKLKKKYNRKNYYPVDITNVSGFFTSDDVLVSVLNRGQGYFNEDFSSLNFHKQEVMDAVEDFLLLAINKYVPVFEENFFDSGFVKAGLSSMQFNWRYSNLNNILTVRFPDIMREKEPVRSFNFAFFSGAVDIEEQRKFIKWFYNENNLLKLSKLINVFPPFKSAFNTIFTKKELDIYRDILSRAYTIPNFSVYPSFENMFNELLEKTAYDIVNIDYNRDGFINELLEIKGITEYLITSY